MMMSKFVQSGAPAIVVMASVVAIAALVQAQYNTFDSDSNSESLGKLMRNSARLHNPQQQPQLQGYQPMASRNLYNKQQALQFASSHNQRRGGNNQGFLGGADSLGAYPQQFMGAASNGRGRQNNLHNNNNDDDDDDSPASAASGASGDSNFDGPNFNSPFDGPNSNLDSDGDSDERSGLNGDGNAPLNLNQAASGGYPSSQGDYSGANSGQGGDTFGLGFNFGGSPSAYGPSADGNDFGSSSDGYEGDGRRQKAGSAPMGHRGFGGGDDDSGATQYGPNSAINAGERDPDDEGRSGYAPDGQGDGEDDD